MSGTDKDIIQEMREIYTEGGGFCRRFSMKTGEEGADAGRHMTGLFHRVEIFRINKKAGSCIIKRTNEATSE